MTLGFTKPVEFDENISNLIKELVKYKEMHKTEIPSSILKIVTKCESFFNFFNEIIEKTYHEIKRNRHEEDQNARKNFQEKQEIDNID